MKYCELTKKVKLILLQKSVVLTPYEMKECLFAQYNPDKFKLYNQCSYGFTPSTVLKMGCSPHVQFLSLLQLYNPDNIIEQSIHSNYFKMQKLYFHNKENYAKKRATEFIQLYANIQKEGIKKAPAILCKPLIKSPYNTNSKEVWEGHHRIACAIASNLNCKVKLYDWNIE